MKTFIQVAVAFLISVLFISLFIKGAPTSSGSLLYQYEKETSVGGPFESTNSNSRYALIEAIVEDGTIFLNDQRARFAAPDIVYYDGRYFSIFTPGISFLAIPFYLLGKIWGVPQLTTYLGTTIFALLNLFLVARIARKLGASNVASFIAGFLFLFGTDNLAYALTLTQHQVSVTLILLSLLNLWGPRTVLKNLILGSLFGVGLLVDIPNAFMLLPAVLVALYKHFNIFKGDRPQVSISLMFLTMLLGLLPFLVIFGWYNLRLTGNPMQIGQNLGRTDYPATKDKLFDVIPKIDPSASRYPYESRSLINGLYILLASNERSWIFYSPVVFVGIVGLYFAYKEKSESRSSIKLIVATALINLVSYAMFGDPWGGWSFGPRYLIPASAVLSTGIGFAVTKLGKYLPFALVFLVLSLYSLSISAVGALTTNAIPPKIEAVALPDPIPYTYDYNFQRLENNLSSSLVYNLFLSPHWTATQFLYLYMVISGGVFIFLYIIEIYRKDKVKI